MFLAKGKKVSYNFIPFLVLFVVLALLPVLLNATLWYFLVFWSMPFLYMIYILIPYIFNQFEIEIKNDFIIVRVNKVFSLKEISRIDLNKVYKIDKGLRENKSKYSRRRVSYSSENMVVLYFVKPKKVVECALFDGETTRFLYQISKDYFNLRFTT